MAGQRGRPNRLLAIWFYEKLKGRADSFFFFLAGLFGDSRLLFGGFGWCSGYLIGGLQFLFGCFFLEGSGIF